MIPDNVLYTDGHNVTVTDTTFQVKNATYRLNGITKHGLLTMQPHRLPAMLLILIGAISVICGLLSLIPSSTIPDMQINNTFISANAVAIMTGGLLILIGTLVLGMLREKY